MNLSRLMPFFSTQGYLPWTTAYANFDTYDSTTLNGLNLFEEAVESIKSDLIAVYPFVGDTESKRRYNFVDPTTFQLTFATGWTHYATGSKPTNSHAGTGVIPSTHLTQNSAGATFYSRTNRQLDYGMPIGATSNGNAYSFGFTNRTTLNQVGARVNIGALITVVSGVTDSSGIWTMNRNDSTNQQIYKDNTLLLDDLKTSVGLPTVEIYIGSNNNDGAPEYRDNEELGIVVIHKGLTSTKITTLHNAINVFKTALIR